MRKYKHHKYTLTPGIMSGDSRHCWEFVGPKGALSFNASIPADGTYGTICGLEFHNLEGDGAPDHVRCGLTGGRCWHDGASAYATDTVWPAVSRYLGVGNHRAIFDHLEVIASGHFNDYEAEPCDGQGGTVIVITDEMVKAATEELENNLSDYVPRCWALAEPIARSILEAALRVSRAAA